MNKVFVVKNQHGLYLNKQQEWISGADNQTLFRTPHRDEAINTVFEASSRDIYLRAEAVACDLDAKNNPIVTAGETPPAQQAELPIAPTEEVVVEEAAANEPNSETTDVENTPESTHLIAQ